VAAQGIAECCGCTGVTALVARTASGGLRVSCANAGDARALLVRLPAPPAGGTACAGEPLSHDHVPSCALEAARIAAAGGIVARGRVLGVLAVSRAIGDVCLKPSVTPLPHTAAAELAAGERAALLLFCDGVSAVMTDEQTARCVADALAAADAAEAAAEAAAAEAGGSGASGAIVSGDVRAAALAAALVAEALRRGTRDNVTVVAVLL
jgi:serine/threonine protein phosphatase PrpC